MEQLRGRRVHEAHLFDELAHLRCTGTRGRLVGRDIDPLDEPGAEQPGDRHYHERDRAVPADEVTPAGCKRRIYHLAVHGVEDDHRILGHAQLRGGIYPATVPAGGTQPRMDICGVLSALATHDCIEACKRADITCISEGWNHATDVRRGAARLRSAEEDRLDELEVALRAHTRKKHRPDHAAPPDETDPH